MTLPFLNVNFTPYIFYIITKNHKLQLLYIDSRPTLRGCYHGAKYPYCSISPKNIKCLNIKRSAVKLIASVWDYVWNIFASILLPHRHIARFVNDSLPLPTANPLEQLLAVRIRILRCHRIELRCNRICPIFNVFLRGCNAVERQQLNLVVLHHLRAVKTERVADCILVVLIVCRLLDDSAHSTHNVLLWRRHQRPARHQVLERSLTAASFVALEGAYLSQIRSQCTPVRYLSRINLPNLLHRQAVDRILCIDKKDKRLPPDRRKGQFYAVFLRIRGLLF